MDVLAAGIRISIIVPTSRLRSYVATGKFPGLVSALEIVELFDAPETSGMPIAVSHELTRDRSSA